MIGVACDFIARNALLGRLYMPGRVKVPLVEGVEVGPRVGLTFGEPEHHANGRESVIVIAVL